MQLSQLALIELIQQMPLTDRELETLKAAQEPAEPDQPGQARSEQPAPSPDPASKFTGPDPALADRICEQILDAGRGSIMELIRLIRDPGDPGFADYKAEYLLHCLVLYAGRPGKDAQRKLVMEALAAQLGNDRMPKPIRGLLIRELQWVGDERVTNELGQQLEDEELCPDAVRALVAIGGAGQHLRAALGKSKGRNRLSLLQSLAVLHDEASKDILRQMTRDEDRDVRLAAAWGLANLADAGSIDLLLKMGDTDVNYERSKITHACLVLAEKLAAGGHAREAARIYTHLRNTRTEKADKYIRDLAENALRSLVV